MARRGFDRFFVANEIGVDRRMDRLTPAERWAFIAGVLATASKSPVRGALLIAPKVPATAQDIARQANVPVKVAHSAMEKLRDMEILVHEDESRVDVVLEWDDWQVEPTSDPRAAKRMALHRNRGLRAAIRERDRDRCRYCNAVVNWLDRRGTLGGTYDHVDPDGPTDETNLVVACRGCNSRKGSKTPSEAGMDLLGPTLRSSSDLDRELNPDLLLEEKRREENRKEQEEVGSTERFRVIDGEGNDAA